MRRLALAGLIASLSLSSAALADGYRYQPGLHPDPFRAPELQAVAPAEDADLLELKLTALVTGRSQPMAMVENAAGEARILKVGDFVGRGRVEAIRSDRVVVVVTHLTANGPVKVEHALKMAP